MKNTASPFDWYFAFGKMKNEIQITIKNEKQRAGRGPLCEEYRVAMIKTDTLIRISGVPLASAVCRLKQLHCIVWRGGVPPEATPFSGVPLASAVCRFCVCMDLHGQDYDLARTVAVR